jgi:hypothetical protein
MKATLAACSSGSGLGGFKYFPVSSIEQAVSVDSPDTTK